MAVLRSKRQLAKTEFENTFATLYNEVKRYTIAIPRRRQKWLCKEINKLMNQAYRDVIEVNDYYHIDKVITAEHRKQMACVAAGHLYDLEKPMIVMWNVQRFETDKMARLVDLFNRELGLLNKINKYTERTDGFMMLDWRAVNNAEFLKTMSELHRYTHGKVANARMDYDDTSGALLIQAVDDALYSLMKANRKIPTTRKEYEKRRDNISRAIMCLKEMNRYLLSYFNLQCYSERVMSEWTKLLTQEQKLLYAIQSSDKKRFGKLA